MSIFTKLGVNVAAPFNADGTPRQISPQDFQIWMTEVERLVKGLLAGVGGLELPELIYKYVITGGDENNIIGQPNATPPSAAGEALFTIEITRPNTGNVTINGKPLLTSSGNQIVAGGLVSGIWLFLDDGENFRLVSDQAGQAIMNAAEQAAQAAQASRDIVENLASDAVSQGNVPIYSSRNAVEMLVIPAGITAFRTNGYAVPGDGGDALYKRVASEPTHNGKVKSSDGAWWELVNSVVRVEQFGGFTGTDVTAPAQSALDFLAELGGGELQFISPGVYSISTCNLSDYTSIFVSDGVTVAHLEDAAAPMFLSAGAKSGVQIPLSSDVNARATSVPVSNASSLAAGDWIILKDTADYSTDSAAIGYKSGESLRIKSISGNTLNFDRPIYGSFQPDQKYSIARGAHVEKVNPKRNIRIYGPGAVRGHKNINVGPIEMRYVDGARVLVNEITEFGGCGILFRSCLNWEASPKFVADGRNEVGAGFPGYGVAVWGACDVGSMHGVNVTKTRHAFTTMGSADGGASRIRIADNIVFENDFTGLDTHEGVHEITFENNKVFGGNAENSAGGINTRAPTTRIINNVIIGVPGSGINAVGQALRSVLIAGNHLEDIGSVGINSGSSIRGLRIHSNTVIRCGANGITILGGSYDTVASRINVYDNLVSDFGRTASARSGIQVVTSTESTVYVCGNTIESINGAEGRGIYISSGTITGEVSGNRLRGLYLNAVLQIPTSLVGDGNEWDQSPSFMQVNIPKDGIAFLKGTSAVHFQISISSSGEGAALPNGILSCRTNDTPQCLALSQFGANVLFTTGPLTGTTGGAGKFTISAVSGGVYFENRSVGATTIRVVCSGGIRG